MRDEAKLATWTAYQAAWSDMSAGKRRALLDESVNEHCIYSDPTSCCEGAVALMEHIERSREKVPGASFRNDKFLDHHDQGLSEWTMFDGTGAVVATGTSYARFGVDGRLTHMTGFFELKQS